MNLEILENFGQNYPEDFDGALDCFSIAVTCAFNRRGSLLAVGCNDGRIVIWDFLTRGIAKIISGHTHPICSLSWSRNGCKLLSSSTDNTVSIWDVATSDCDKTFRFPSPVLKAQFHPRDSSRMLLTMLKHATILLHIDGSHQTIAPDDETDLNIVACFDHRGQHIYTGNARGRVLVYNIENLEVIASFRISAGTSSATAIKSMEFSRRGNCLLINSADRIIRIYDAAEVLACGKDGEPEPMQKLQDLVNRTTWKKCCLSGDGEYVVAGSARQHSLYIWEKSSRQLVKILNGTKGELLLDVVWHPVRPVIASVSSGVVSIWSQAQVENWSAFAPDFKELDENVEYEERESEFDIEDEDKIIEEIKNPEEEEVDVDVETVQPISAFLSSDEETDDPTELIYLPISPDIEEPEDNNWAANGSALSDQQVAPSPEVDRKRSAQSRDSALSPKKKKAKIMDIDLPDSPLEEAPQLGTGRKGQPSDKQSAPVNANRKGAAARPKQGQRTRGRISKTVMGNSSPENSQLDDGFV